MRLAISSQLGDTAKRVAARSSTLKRKVRIQQSLNHSLNDARSATMLGMTTQLIHHLIIEDRQRAVETRTRRAVRWPRQR